MYIKAVRQKRHLRNILMLYSKWYKKIGKSIVTESAMQVEGELAKQ